jgi:hypothetical protein
MRANPHDPACGWQVPDCNRWTSIHERPRLALVARLSMLAVLGVVMATDARAQTVNIVGIGAATCARFNEEIARKPPAERDYFAWAQGFMSGALMRAPQGVDEDLDLLPPSFPLQQQADFLRAFCSENPNLSYMDAVHTLYQRLKGRPT